MTEARLPSQIRRGLDEILLATEALIEAAGAEDVPAIHLALRRRAESIDRLEPRVARFRAGLGQLADRLLRPDGTRIAARAAEARARLERIREQTREELARLVRGGAAARSYEENPSGARVLDRSG